MLHCVVGSGPVEPYYFKLGGVRHYFEAGSLIEPHYHVGSKLILFDYLAQRNPSKELPSGLVSSPSFSSPELLIFLANLGPNQS